ncbi:MAG: BON domain-containing protein [Cyanobacteriota bacterium]|nr:BON domain-containing protein [Cyanobacteriota bacterium]
MAWLSRLFGQTPSTAPASSTASEDVPLERQGLNGEYDQNGLAKRVAATFDLYTELQDIETVWVAQTGSTVVLKGKVTSPALQAKLIEVAGMVKGATAVSADDLIIEA